MLTPSSILRRVLTRNGRSARRRRASNASRGAAVSSEKALRQKQVDVSTDELSRDKALSRGGLRKLFSDFDLFGKFTGWQLRFSHSFIRDNPRTVEKFVAATANAIEWARSHSRDEVVARYEAIIKSGRGATKTPAPSRIGAPRASLRPVASFARASFRCGSSGS